MALPLLRRRGARHAARGLLDPLPGHRRRRRGTWARRGSQTTFNNGRAVIARRRRGRASSCSTPPPSSSRRRRPTSSSSRARVRVKGSPDRSVAIADLGRRAARLPRQGLGRGARTAPEVDAEGCVGQLGIESFLAPQLITHAARVKVDRDTGVVRVLRGRRRARLGHDPQPDRRRRPGRTAAS